MKTRMLEFIREVEGFSLTGYVPEDDGGRIESGVTIGTGIDLGFRTIKELRNLRLPTALIQKLALYIQLRGERAKTWIKKHPLVLSKLEVDELDNAVLNKTLEELTEAYNEATYPITFDALPEEIQIVIFSVAHQYGNLKKRTPNFWKQITSLDLKAAYDNLLSFGDGFPTRRKREAMLFLVGIKKLNGEIQTNGRK